MGVFIYVEFRITSEPLGLKRVKENEIHESFKGFIVWYVDVCIKKKTDMVLMKIRNFGPKKS